MSIGRAWGRCRIGACYVAAFSGLKGSKAMRYNKGITINSMFPTREKGRCAYCQGPLTGRQRRWCGYECERTAVTEFLIVKGDVGTIRKELYKRDGGKCAGCGAENCEWEADHITAVVNGGGGCDLSGYQTLCQPCHRKKTREDVRTARLRTRDGGLFAAT